MPNEEEYALSQVDQWLTEHNCAKTGIPVSSSLVDPDAAYSDNEGNLYLVKLKIVNGYRSQTFRALIGDEILRYNKFMDDAACRRSLLIFTAMMPRISFRAENDLKEYARDFLPNLNWHVSDASGQGFSRLNGEERRFGIDKRDLQQWRGVGKSAGIGGNLFSNKNQWLFKVLLLAGLDKRYWGGPSQRPRNINDLARISKVSQPSASNFVKTAEQAGYLSRSHNEFHLHECGELLEDWFFFLKNRRQRRLSLRSLYGDGSLSAFVDKIRSYCAACPPSDPPVLIGHHQACHLFGMGRSNVMTARIYANRSVDEVLNALDLVVDDEGSSLLTMIPPPTRDAILRGCVICDGVPVTDILQCYFDVRTSFARGDEQADYIMDKILRPHLEKGSS